jgi:hypothetical protein
MKIACIGWGSLIWRPDNLLIRRTWFPDGPFLPIEFTRQSKNGRLTLVITLEAKYVRTLWALTATEDLSIAKESLCIRENIPEDKTKELIGSMTRDEVTSDVIELTIQDWIRKLNLDAAIWTKLSPRFKNVDNKIPTLEETISYLKGLDINKKMTAKEYICRAPKQIDTDYRRDFEKEFGWSYIK